MQGCPDCNLAIEACAGMPPCMSLDCFDCKLANEVASSQQGLMQTPPDCKLAIEACASMPL